MYKLLVTCFAVFVGLAGAAGRADAGLFSGTGPVIVIFAGDLFLGEAKGKLDGSGTMRIQSRKAPEVVCLGQSASTAEAGGTGEMQCNDGVSASFEFRRLSRTSGYGTGNSRRGLLSFTYGLSAPESGPYLKLPAGKLLSGNGAELMLTDLSPVVQATAAPAPVVQATAIPVLQPVSHPLASDPPPGPVLLLSTATQAVVARLGQDKNLQTTHPAKFTKLVETRVLPLFDFHHMTRLAVARSWQQASPEQRDALTDGFRTLLVRTYSTALTNYHDQVIEYKPIHITPGETDVTVKSVIKQSGGEGMAIDYDMEKTANGWKIYDVRISGISLVATYRSPFAETLRNGGLDALIDSLASRNQQPVPEPNVDESGPPLFVLMYSAIRNFFHRER